MSLEDSTVARIYKCENCLAEIAYKQKAFEQWKKKCPCCSKNALIMDRAHLNISIFIDPNIPKTFGSQSDQNIKHAEKEGSLPSKKKNPWWRKNKNRLDYRILKNPQRYIQEGVI